MLTDTTLRSLKPRTAPYKVSDRDGMYVVVAPTGTITFRYDYRLNARRETLTYGRYDPRGLTLAGARENPSQLFLAAVLARRSRLAQLVDQHDSRALGALAEHDLFLPVPCAELLFHVGISAEKSRKRHPALFPRLYDNAPPIIARRRM